MDYTPLNNHMRVKNHMAMWILWILWILWVEYSAKRLYKPLCAFFGLCGSRVDLVDLVGRWSCHRCRRLRVHLLFVDC